MAKRSYRFCTAHVPLFILPQAHRTPPRSNSPHLTYPSSFAHVSMTLQLLPVIVASLLHVARAITDTTCTPARCGNMNIAYPFSLGGVQPLHCGYPALALTCDADAGRAYLSSTFREHLYLVRNISYGDTSMVVSIEATFAGNGSCPFPDFNVSSGLALFPVRISAANEADLVFVHNCTALLPRRLKPRNLSCGPQRMEAFVGHRRSGTGEGSVADDVPKNCSFTTVPVRGGGEARDYEELITNGFLVEWETLGDCSACSRSGGECRLEEGSFRCVCYDGLPCSSRGYTLMYTLAPYLVYASAGGGSTGDA